MKGYVQSDAGFVISVQDDPKLLHFFSSEFRNFGVETKLISSAALLIEFRMQILSPANQHLSSLASELEPFFKRILSSNPIICKRQSEDTEDNIFIYINFDGICNVLTEICTHQKDEGLSAMPWTNDRSSRTLKVLESLCRIGYIFLGEKVTTFIISIPFLYLVDRRHQPKNSPD